MRLLIPVLLLAACEAAPDLESTAAGPTPEVATRALPVGGQMQTDTFIQGDLVGGYADILFVVDDSGSMSEEQDTLARSFDTFIHWIAQHNVDFHIGVTTTDAELAGGRFVGTPAVLERSTPELVTKFQETVRVGTNGSGIEQGLGPALAAVTPPLVDGANAGFLRENAKLYVVIVSDEDDQTGDLTPVAVTDVVGAFTAVKGGHASRVHYTVIGGGAAGCTSTGFGGIAEPSPRYDALLTATGGLFGSICDADFGTTLQNLAFEVTTATGEYFLTRLPIPSSIAVTVDGAPQPTDRWEYHPGTNSVELFDAFIPAPGAQIVITYQVEGTVGATCDHELRSGEVVHSQDGGAESWKYFCIAVPAGDASLLLHTWNGKGDSDLYVRYGDLPAGAAYDLRSVEEGIDDTLIITDPEPGVWHVGVYGWSKYSDVSLQAILYDAP